MDRLGQVVLLAGKNGSGKTRLLNTLLQTIQAKPKKQQLDAAIKEIDQLKKAKEGRNIDVLNQARALESASGTEQKAQYENNIRNFNQEIERYSLEIENRVKLLEWDMISTDDIYESYPTIPFVPKDLKLMDHNNYRKSELIQHAHSVDNVGIGGLTNGTFARIYTIQEKWFNATHQNSNVSEQERELAIEEYQRLKELILIFLNTNLDRNIDGEPTIFGFPLGQANLSDGQKVLIQLCLAIHCQKKALKDIVIFLDEPENHGSFVN